MMQLQEPFNQGTENEIEFYSGEEEEEPITKKKNNNNKKKIRFSEEQVRSLETIFSSETKLEPKKKVQVARDLGLQPKQVAIWFQNKRARWKSKQIESNYKLLQANFDILKARFDAINKEREVLLDQLQELHSLSQKSSIANNKQFDKQNRKAISGLPEKDKQGTIIYCDDNKSENMSYMASDNEADELINIGVNSSGGKPMLSSLKWCGFDTTNLFDQLSSSTSSHWWDDSWTSS